MVFVKKTALLLLVAALLGCKASETKVTTIDAEIGPIKTPKERNFTASELVIGRRICAALKSKRAYFETLTDMQEQYRFRGELKNCGSTILYGQTEFTARVSTVSSTGFEYVATSNRANYFKDVVTDQSGAMKSLCETLATSDSISNTSLNGSSYLVINLLIADGYDRYEVTKRSRDAAGNYNFVSSEGVSVITQATQAAEKYFGIEKDRARYSVCSGSKDFSTVRQIWLTSLTN
jgi:hypothetical protein